MSLDKKIKQLTNTFELRAEIADLIWETDRLKEIEKEAVANEDYEKAQTSKNVIIRNKKLIKTKEKVLKEKEKLL